MLEKVKAFLDGNASFFVVQVLVALNESAHCVHSCAGALLQRFASQQVAYEHGRKNVTRTMN